MEGTINRKPRNEVMVVHVLMWSEIWVLNRADRRWTAKE
jgi:hypothetical protein